ncbi:MAG: Ig-like domain-containing protein, partial [Terriglobales bacterium]
MVGPTTYTFVTALTAANQVLLVTSGSSSTKETDLAKNLEAAINANSAQCVSSPCFGSGTVANPAATATESTSTVTMTATTTGSAGNFSVSWGPGFQNGPEDIVITNTTPGQGPNYVSGITITAPGSGYQPETPITLTGGGGTGAIAVANTSIGTASSSYQPAYGAAPGWDMATGLGTPNASALVCNGQWGTVCSSSAVASSLNPSVYGQAVNFAATVTGNNPTGTVQFYVDGGLFDTETLVSGTATSISTSTLSVGTHTVTAMYSGDANNSGSTGILSGGQVVNTASAGISVGSSVNPSNSGQSVTFTATISGQYGLLKKRGAKPQDVTGTVQWSGNTGCGTVPVVTGNPGTATCTTTTLPVGTDVITATYSGDANHSGGTGTLSGGQVVNQVSTTVGVSSSLDPSTYGQAVNFAATVTGNNPTGTVQFYVDGGLFDTETLMSGVATSINTSTLAVGTHTVTATYSGDANNTGGTGTLSGGQVVNT